MNSKYSKFLTVLLIIVIVAIVGIIGFLGFKLVYSMNSKKEAEDFADTFQNNVSNTNKTEQTNSTNETEQTNINLDISNTENTSASNTSNEAQRYNGYLVAGTIEIPVTGLKCPILAEEEYSPSALATSVVVLHGPGLNQVGNTTIAGHNYRNGNFFSNNKKLSIGDKVYITDLTGTRLSYTIYNKYEADENESDFITRDTNGAKEISLTTCTDDSKARLIIWAKADE